MWEEEKKGEKKKSENIYDDLSHPAVKFLSRAHTAQSVSEKNKVTRKTKSIF